MHQRLLALSLSLLLLLTQQLGVLHLLSHGLQHPAPAAQQTAADAGPADGHGQVGGHGHADAGDALCQVCLVLAALGMAAWPMAWGWWSRQARHAAPLAVARPAPRRVAPAPWQARAPPALLH